MDRMEFKKIIKVTKLKKIGDNEDLSTAYHEAGHALINLLYGIPSKEVSIIPNEVQNSLGHNESEWHDTNEHYDFTSYIGDLEDWSVQKQLDYLVSVSMAGIIGQAFYIGKYNWPGAVRDFERIIDHFFGYGITDVQNLQAYWDKTFELISNNNSALISIANDLYKFKILDAKYFKSLSQRNGMLRLKTFL